MRPQGVTGAVVMEASPWVEDNQWVLNLAKKNPVISRRAVPFWLTLGQFRGRG
jgi:hypothetical protein